MSIYIKKNEEVYRAERIDGIWTGQFDDEWVYIVCTRWMCDGDLVLWLFIATLWMYVYGVYVYLWSLGPESTLLATHRHCRLHCRHTVVRQ